MKIILKPVGSGPGPQTTIDLSCMSVTLEQVYTGIGLKTDQGLFGIAMRDDGIEVMLDGKLVWSSTSEMGNAPVSDEAKQQAWERCSGIVPTPPVRRQPDSA